MSQGYERHTSFTNRRGAANHQPSTELTFTAPKDTAYDRDDDDDVVVHAGALAAHDANAHFAVHIQDLEDGRGRGYNRSVSFADHPPHTLPHPAADAAIASVLAQGSHPATTYDVSDSQELPPHTNGYHDVAQSPIGPVYGGNPHRTLDRQPTFGKVSGRHHVSATEAFPAQRGVADRSAGGTNNPLNEPLGVDLGPGKRKVPWAGKFFVNVNWVMAFIFTTWFTLSMVYFGYRGARSLDVTPRAAVVWAIWVYVLEILGWTTLLLYAICLLVNCKKWDAPPIRHPFSVRVMIPCYKEDIATLEETLECAIQAAKKALEKDYANAVHVYLCDDAPPDHKEEYKGQKLSVAALRQELVDKLYQIHDIPVIRVTRKKEKSANPKSDNLNNCLKQIYGEGQTPPESEVIAVFDADQAAHSHFFTSTLPWMDSGDDVGLVQSPQVFRGVHWRDDVFNHENIGFWHYLQPAYNVLGFISCAGTNFLVRASAFAQAGYFPNHSLTEDYAAGMEMCRNGWREVYVEDELVRGTAPDKVRAAFGQRSRWCKGPYQMLFSWKSPLICKGLSLFNRILYASPCYIYIVSALASPTFMAIPVVFIWFNIFPANLPTTVLWSLISYAILSNVVKYYVRPGRNILHDLRSHWNAEISTKNFWWMYAKASVRGTMAACGCAGLGWTSGAGSKSSGLRLKAKEFQQDLLPLFLWALLLIVTTVYGFFMVAAGANFVGPLGISIVWCIYHALSPVLLLWYSVLPFEHEIDKKHNRCWYLFGRGAFDILCTVAFVTSFAAFIIAIILAFRMNQKSQGICNTNNITLAGRLPECRFFLTPRQVYRSIIKHQDVWAQAPPAP